MSISYRQLTPELRQQIIDAFNNRMECRQITEELGLSRRLTRRVLAEAGTNITNGFITGRFITDNIFSSFMNWSISIRGWG